MSTPLDQLQQQALQPPPPPPPPPAAAAAGGGLYQEANTTHSGHASVGPVIAVVIVIAILGIIAGLVGRLCSGRRVMGLGEYDFEGWIEKKCSKCIDGRIDNNTSPPPPPPPPPQQQQCIDSNTTNSSSPDSVPITIPAETHEETSQPEKKQSTQNPHAATNS